MSSKLNVNVVEYTAEQQAALTTWSESVALSAGAGCGKTFVLTQRFLSHLDPQDDAPQANLGEIVAITFTDAAARELRDRVRRECLKRLTDPTNNAPEAWLALLRSIDSARISTIHALCSRLIRSHAVELGLDPTFRVLDAPATAVLEIEAIDDVLRDLLASRDGAVMKLAADYGLSKLKTMIRELMPKCRLAEFAAWMFANPDETVATWQALYHEQRRESLREIAEGEFAATLLRLLRSFEPTQPERFVVSRAVVLDLLPRLLTSESVDADLQQLLAHARVRGPDRKTICGEKDWSYPEEYAEYRDVCEQFRKEIERFRKAAFDLLIARIAAENGMLLVEVTSKVVTAYEQAKASQAAIDFDDLLFQARRLLTDEQFAGVQRQWQQQVKLLLVDEFQDTDQVQVDIVKALVGEGLTAGGLFFVGDFKQSIYRFRGAEPRVFAALSEEVPKGGRLRLTTNFRSQPAILKFVNTLFGQVFDTYDALQHKRPQITATPAVEFLWTTPPENETDESGAQPNAKVSIDALRTEEAQRIAKRLRTMIDGNEMIVAEGGKPRAVKPGDIVILFRALSDVQFYEKALESAGIDYYLVGGHAFYSQQEVFDVLNLLRAVSSACDDVSLAGVLRSPFFSLADETLFWLAARHGSLNVALAAEMPPRELSDLEQAKVHAASETISELRRLKEIVTPAALLQTALDRTGYDAILLAEFLGERKLANLHKLLELARATEQVAGGGFDAFLEQLSEFTTSAPKEALAATNPESADVVRLMTVHMAKGLEFPVVVVADLDRDLQVRWPAAAFDPQLGPLVRLPSSQEERSAVGHDLYQRMHLPEEESEFDRLLYVACTRAADYLVLSAAAKDLGKPSGAWLKRLAEHFDLRTGVLRSAPSSAPLVKFSQLSDYKPGRQREAREDFLKIIAEAESLVDHGNGEVPSLAAPLIADRTKRQQFSVTRLSGSIIGHNAYDADAGVDENSKPGGGKWLEPLGLGTLVHALLERARFGQSNPVRQWCELLAPIHMDENESLAATEAQTMVERFLASPRCAELAAAKSVKREIEFLLRWPLDAADSDMRYLQGYIDCIYRDAAGGWHLLDFKTNQTEGKKVSQVAESYELQLAVYALALEQALGVRPVDLVLHFLREGKEHKFLWDDASRAKAIAQIDQAIAAALVC